MNVPSIKFSKEYPKLHNQITAILVHVKVIVLRLEEDLIEYDTKAIDGSYYKLPEPPYIHLTFLGNKEIPFCTIRKYTIEKYEFYKSMENRWFNIERNFNE